jgi:hypothetical protein
MSGKFTRTEPSINPLNISNWKRLGSFYISSFGVGILTVIIILLISFLIKDGTVIAISAFVCTLFGTFLLLTTYDYLMNNHTEDPVKEY